ncbi:helix-turn-helix transcriptional regulator [Archangium violaceum]|nr:helix-turn-helix transcriptional regulator [Archangium violaceum]
MDDDLLQKTIGEAARTAREGLGLTQAQVAQKAGMSAQVYGRIERGGMMPSVPALRRLAAALGVSPAVLLDMSPAKCPPRTRICHPRPGRLSGSCGRGRSPRSKSGASCCESSTLRRCVRNREPSRITDWGGGWAAGMERRRPWRGPPAAPVPLSEPHPCGYATLPHLGGEVERGTDTQAPGHRRHDRGLQDRGVLGRGGPRDRLQGRARGALFCVEAPSGPRAGRQR